MGVPPISQKPLTQDALSADETMLSLLEQSRDCVRILGLEGTLDFMNCSGRDALDAEKFGDARGKVWWALWPAHTQDFVRSMFERARKGHEVEFSADCPTQMGNMRKWMVTLKPMQTDDNTVVGVLCTSSDIDPAE
ncbi:MAG: PAS domain-containing protein [Erythrobacter sp.]